MSWLVLSARGLVRSPDGRVLLLKRSKKCRYCPDCWELGGGKLETFNLKNDFRREIKEEAGLSLVKVTFLGLWLKRSALVKIWPGWILVFFVSAVCPKREIRLSNEHVAGGWFTPAEAESLLLTPESRRALEKYARRKI